MNEHAPESASVAIESPEEVSAEKRAELVALFERIGNEPLSYLSPNRQETIQIIAFRNDLRRENGNAAAYLLEKINQEFRSSRFSSNRIWYFVDWLYYCTDRRHSAQLAEILLHDNVALSDDRSNKSKILDHLRLIGTPEVISSLLDFSDKILTRMHYQTEDEIRGRRLLQYDLRDVMQTLIAIRDYAEDRDQVPAVLAAIDALQEKLETHGFSRITDPQKAELEERNHEQHRGFQTLFELPPDETHQQHDEEYIEMMDTEPDYDPDGDLLDEEIGNEYNDHEYREVESRLEVIKRLRHEIKIEEEITEEPEEDDAKFLRRHYLEYREENPHPMAPTLGIEIEIRESTIDLPQKFRNLKYPFDELSKTEELEYEQIIEEKKTKYRKTQGLGIPYGYDKFWEFSHKPVEYYFTLSREVQALIEMGLINKEDKKHPLHLTIGWISAKMRGGEGTNVLFRALEASGWSTTGHRLLRPYKGHNGWNIKGKGGILERFRAYDDIALDVPYAVEGRTFQLQSLAGLDRMLRSAFFLGAALRAHLEQQNPGEFYHKQGDRDQIEKLAKIWRNFEARSAVIFEEFNLFTPREPWRAPNSHEEKEIRAENHFVPFAELLNEAAENPESRGAQFVREIRKLIIEARNQVKNVMYLVEVDRW